MVVDLVEKLLRFQEVSKIIITVNITEEIVYPPDERIITINNLVPRGFGENHNSAFKFVAEPWFVVINPDVTLLENPFKELIRVAQETGAALISPKALTPAFEMEDNWRYFPTIISLFLKFLGHADGRYPVVHNSNSAFPVDWVSGLCMLFSSGSFRSLNGFDPKYYMYYEDVDICWRIWRGDMKVMACPSVAVVHDARRESRRSLRYMRWHAQSMIRFLITKSWRDPRADS
jgi:hypothetical protein